MPANRQLSRFFRVASAALFLTVAAGAQSSSSSSQSGTPPQQEDSTSRSTPRRPQVEASGSAVTLETSEPLFDIAAALNLCGYDDGLEQSDPVRAKVRADLESAAIATPEAADSRRALCAYVHTHQLSDAGLNLAQYVSLALYTSPPPELAPLADETELPPDSTQVVNLLPLLRTFAEQTHLHATWIKYRPEYEALVDLVHDPLTRTILNTNIYLKAPASSYDGRRFLVLLEPMLAPAATNARIYGNDYTVVVSPAANPPGTVRMEQIRHTYLHYEVEPLVYSRATAMNRLLPLLKTVQDAPIDFNYKSDIVSFITECMIKAIEAHTMDVGLPKPEKTTSHERVDQERYTADMVVYERQTEAARHNASELAMRQGWVLTGYFYDALNQMQHDGSSLKDSIGQMVYGMDIGREAHHDQQIVFLPETTHDVVRRVPRQPTGLDLAEMKLFKGDKDGADEIAEKVLASPTAGHSEDHARANYLIARINLLDQQPDDAVTHFQAALETSRDPRTLAWCHIYLGRLADMQQSPDRKKAVAEYKLALNLRDDRPDTKAAAEAGIRAPFAPPKREAMQDQESEDNAPVDPTGKAEKDAYKPPQ